MCAALDPFHCAFGAKAGATEPILSYGRCSGRHAAGALRAGSPVFGHTQLYCWISCPLSAQQCLDVCWAVFKASSSLGEAIGGVAEL